MMEILKEFFVEEDGIGVVEIILILVILIGLVIIFKTEISTIITNAFKAISGDANTILN